MFRRLLIAAVLLAGSAGIVSAQTRVTFLMRNGQRIVGDLTYKGGADYTLNGQDINANDVAVIAFVPNDPTPQEVSQIPTVDNNSNELERHVFVMRDGSMVFGKVYKFSPDGNIVTFDDRVTSSRCFHCDSKPKLSFVVLDRLPQIRDGDLRRNSG